MTTALGSISRAAYKRSLALFRSFGATPTYPHWQARAEICARCPLAHTDGKTTTCGRPFLQQMGRRPEDGCGCPVVEKAKDPAEHCPVDATLSPTPTPTLSPTPTPTSTSTSTAACNCKWCRAGLG
jgi:hypothetical protein